MLKKNHRIFIAGHTGLVGNSVLRLLQSKKFKKIITADKSKLNLLNENLVDKFFKKKRPDILIICAARVGGILENKNNQLDFLLDNLKIQNNLLLCAKKYNIKRTIFLGSSCIYPKESSTPIKEEYLMTGKLEKTNESYSLSKIIGLKMSSILALDYKKDVIALMPTNLYGINDNFDIKSSHVIPGLISKFLEAKDNSKKEVFVWGSGVALREFLFVDDLAEAIYLILNTSKKKLVKASKSEIPTFNVGSGEIISIKKLAYKIKNITNFKGRIIFDKKSLDGTLRKDLNSKKIKSLKWKAKIKLDKGLRMVIKSRINNAES